MISNSNNTDISIPSRKNNTALTIIIIFLGIWFYLFKTVIMVATGIDENNLTALDGISLYFLFAWAATTLFLIGVLLWAFFGKENLSIQKTHILLSKKIFGLGISNQFQKTEITNIKFNTVNTNINLLDRNNWAVWGLGKGKIKFDVGKKNYSFGLGLEDEEAILLVNTLKEKTKQNNEHYKFTR